jgi:hypothetical protein
MSSVVNIIDNKNSKNVLINSNMSIWQRGQLATGVTSNRYLADRWKFECSVGTWTLSQSTQSPDPFKFRYSHLIINTNTATPTGNQRVAPHQVLEEKTVRQLVGKRLFYSGWIRASVNATIPVFVYLGASPALNYTYISRDVTVIANQWTYFEFDLGIAPLTQAIVDAHTINGAAGYVGFHLDASPDVTGVLPSNWVTVPIATAPIRMSSSSTKILSLANTSVWFTGFNLGTSPSFSTAGLTDAEELQLCQRYFTRSGLFDGPPFPNGSNGSIVVMQNYNSGNAGSHPTIFPTTMRAVPILSFWDLAGNIGRWSFAANAGTSTTDNIATSGNSFNITNNMWQVVSGAVVGSGSGGVLRVQWTADAEL